MEKKDLFINFTSHNLTKEQKQIANELASEVVDAKDVIHDFAIIANDDGGDVTAMVEAIAKSIAQIVGEKTAYVHFPVSSPRVMANFFEVKGRMGSVPFDPHSGYSYPQFRDCMINGKEHWKTLIDNCKFLFSISERKSVEEHQPDGSVKKISTFQFKGFSEI